MARSYHIFIWKKAPYIRIVVPFITGILLQFYFQFEMMVAINISIIALIFLTVFTFLPESFRYRFRYLSGIFLFVLVCCLGAFITWQKDIRHHSHWYGKYIDSNSAIIGTIKEPLVKKAKTFKALVNIEMVINKDIRHNVAGKALVYFAQDDSSVKLKYGDKVIFKKPLQDIKNSGNPGAFNYKQYCAFQQIFQQVYLKDNAWILLKEKDKSSLNELVFKTRNYILNTLEKYIPRQNESSLAKALLIGYRNDLDRDLLQAYSNAGVVHLIAISGMHLAIIYFFLLWVFARIPFIKNSHVTRLILVLVCLWFFAFLTGAPASVLRSAVMFTFIAIGNTFNSRNSIYNSLSVSAMVLLCYDPYMLWDVGFQLSYLAVLGIVITQKYIYAWFYFKNQPGNYIWKLASVSLAAQVLTLPVCIYYFHQFPLLFLLSNVIAIPLSTIILAGCIALIMVSPIAFVAVYLGKVILAFIWLLNFSIISINSIPFSLWAELSISKTDTFILYLFVVAFLYWLIHKSKAALQLSLSFMLIFTFNFSYQKWKSVRQKKLIVYNIPQKKAIDFAIGSHYFFIGDSDVIQNPVIRNYNIQPAHIALRLHRPSHLYKRVFNKNNFYQFYNHRILMLDTALAYYPSSEKIKIDYIIISKNPSLEIPAIESVFDCKKYIFDASNSPWKIEQWKKECEELHLHFHSVSEQGAFVIDL
ncbi:MAG: ComEC/Rec2 family competence protein [Ginsengibacter sp.]